MRVLWVEDLGADAKADVLLGKHLGGWLDDMLIELYPTVAPGSGWDYAHWREHYRDTPSPNAREVDFCVDLEMLVSNLGNREVVERYDVVLIDIDLTEFARHGHWEQCPDPARGGFWVYQKLLHLGFPSERLAFLTGNGDKAEAFRKQAHQLMLDVPQSFDKTSRGVSEWLAGLEKDGYVRFRRGVIEGCHDLAARIESGNDFSHYLEDEVVPEIDWPGYLESLRTTLPASLDGYSVKQVYRQFLRALGWPWEDRAHPRNLKGHDKFLYKQLLAIGWTMKCLRNWASHGGELDAAETADLAWFALLGFRALSLVDNEMRPYEKLLCGSNGKRLRREHMEQLLAESHLRIAEKSPSESTFFNYLLNELASQHVTGLNYTRELRKVFWHLLAGPKRGLNSHSDSQLTEKPSLTLDVNHYPKWIQTLADATFADTFQSEWKIIVST